MYDVEVYGNLPPETAAKPEGYKEMKVNFWSGHPEVYDGKSEYKLSESDREAIDYISQGIKRLKIRKILDRYAEVEKQQKKPVKQRIKISWFDVAVYACIVVMLGSMMRCLL